MRFVFFLAAGTGGAFFLSIQANAFGDTRFLRTSDPCLRTTHVASGEQKMLLALNNAASPGSRPNERREKPKDSEPSLPTEAPAKPTQDQLTDVTALDAAYLKWFDAVEHGHFDAALELLRRIQEAPTKVLSASNYFISILKLRQSGKSPDLIRRYWEHAHAWRGSWDKLLVDAGATPPESAAPPTDEEWDAIDARIQSSFTAHDVHGFVEGLHAYARMAQWVPHFADRFGRLVPSGHFMSDPLYRSLNETFLALAQDCPAVTPDFGIKARVWEVATLVELERSAEGVPRARALFHELGESDPLRLVALQFWLALSKGSTGQIEALSETRRLLEGTQLLSNRIDWVALYSDMLAGQPQLANEHLRFLEQEVGRADFPSSTNMGQQILARLQLLRGRPLDDHRLTLDIQTWIKKQDLAWLELVTPKSLQEPRFASLNGPLEMPQAMQSGFTPTEILKYNVLLAQDERQSPQVRETAFRNVVGLLGLTSNDLDKIVEMVKDALTYESISLDQRASIAMTGSGFLVKHFSPDRAAIIRQAIPAGALNQEQLAVIEGVESAVRIALERKEGWGRSAFAILTHQDMSLTQLEVTMRVLNRMALAGQADEAEKLIEGARSLEVDPATGFTPASARMQWTRSLALARGHQPIVAFLREQLNALPEAHQPLPAKVLNHMEPRSIGRLSDKECFLMIVHWINSDQIEPGQLAPILEALAQARDFRQRYPRFGLEVLHHALASTADDPSKAACIYISPWLCDIDQEPLRLELEGQLRRFVDNPETRNLAFSRQHAILSLAKIRLRTSKELHPREVFEELNASGVPAPMRSSLQLVYQYNHRQDDECKLIVGWLDANTMSAPGTYPIARAMLGVLGRSSEIKLLDDTVRANLAQRINNLWLDRGNLTEISQALLLATDAHAAGLLPDAWFDFIKASLGSDYIGQSFEQARARLSGNWLKLEEISEAMIKVRPQEYELYYDLAISSHHLGHDEKAEKALAVFLKYCGDHRFYRLCEELYAQLKAAHSKPPKS